MLATRAESLPRRHRQSGGPLIMLYLAVEYVHSHPILKWGIVWAVGIVLIMSIWNSLPRDDE